MPLNDGSPDRNNGRQGAISTYEAIIINIINFHHSPSCAARGLCLELTTFRSHAFRLFIQFWRRRRDRQRHQRRALFDLRHRRGPQHQHFSGYKLTAPKSWGACGESSRSQPHALRFTPEVCDFLQALNSDGCEFTTCSGSRLTLSCTDLSNTDTCGSDTYSISDGTITLAMNFANVSNDGTSGTATVTTTIQGNVSGAATGAVDCRVDMRVNLASDGNYDVTNCDCSFAGEAVSCDSLEENTGDDVCE